MGEHSRYLVRLSTVLIVLLSNTESAIGANASFCEPPEDSTADFPGDVFTPDQRRQGGFVLHGALAVYGFLLIAVVCGDYFIPSVGCICRGDMVIRLHVYPLARDCVLYTAVISVLWAILWDGVVHWYEALLMCLLYCLYCLIMYYDKTLSKKIKRGFRKTNSYDIEKTQHSGAESVCTPRDDCRGPASRSQSDLPMNGTVEKQDSTKSDGRSIFTRPEGCGRSLWWAVTLPITIALLLTVPDPRTSPRLYPLTFCMCIVWIGAASYIVTWMITLIGNTFSISDSTMGLTFLALTGGLPEACASVVNARRGEGSMSISNSLGSNTLGVLLCLGLPWLVRTALPRALRGGPVTIHSPGLVYNTAAQVVCVLVLFVAAAANRFRLDRLLGGLCLTVYLLCLAFVLITDWEQGTACG